MILFSDWTKTGQRITCTSIEASSLCDDIAWDTKTHRTKTRYFYQIIGQTNTHLQSWRNDNIISIFAHLYQHGDHWSPFAIIILVDHLCNNLPRKWNFAKRRFHGSVVVQTRDQTCLYFLSYKKCGGSILTANEPRHDKTNKMSVRPAKTQISLGIRPVWQESSMCAQWVAKNTSFLHADSEDSGQTGRMSRLSWVFAGRTLILLVLSCHGSYT